MKGYELSDYWVNWSNVVITIYIALLILPYYLSHCNFDFFVNFTYFVNFCKYFCKKLVLTDWLTDWPTDRPTDRLTDWVTCWLISLLTSKAYYAVHRCHITVQSLTCITYGKYMREGIMTVLTPKSGIVNMLLT